jgi:UDP-N-acetylmuramoylalanine--D-glutamate ligase
MSRKRVVDVDMMPGLADDDDSVMSFSLDTQLNQRLYWADGVIHYLPRDGQAIALESNKIKLPGLHNIRNIMTCIAMFDLAGISWSERLTDYIYQWPGLKHRCAYVGEINGVRYYNDSKATNVGATKAAIDGFAATSSSPILLIAGGVGKDADFSVLADTFRQYLRALILFGRDADQLLSQAGQEVQSRIVKDMREAVTLATQLAQPGDTVLLSPACASLDMYPNFEHRGNDFESCVEALQ